MPRRARAQRIYIEERRTTTRELKFQLTGRPSGDVDIKVYGFDGEELSGGPVLLSRFDIVGSTDMTIVVPIRWTG